MDNRLIAPLAAIATVLVTIVLSMQIGMAGLAVPLAVFSAIILTSRPRMLLALFWIVTILAPSLEAFIAPTYIKAIEQGIGLYILSILVAELIINRTVIPGTKLVTRIVLVLLVWVGIAHVINRVPARAFGLYVLTYLKHIWLFYFTVRHLRPEDGRAVFRIMLGSFAIQIAFNLAFYAGLNPLPYVLGRGAADASLGTVGDAHSVGYYMITCIVVLVAYLRLVPSFPAKVAACAGALLALVQFFFTFTMHGYPFLVGALGLQHLMSRRSSIRQMLGIIAVTTPLFACLVFLFSMAAFSGLERTILTKGSFRHQWRRIRYGPKWEAYEEVFLHGAHYYRYPLVGAGAGNYTSHTAYLGGRPLSRLPHMFYFYRTWDPLVRMGGSIMAVPRTGYISLYGELGPLGLLLYWGLYVIAAVRIMRQARNGSYREPHRQALAEAFVPVMLFFLILNVLVDRAAMLHLNLGLWIWAGALWNPSPAEAETAEVTAV